MLVSSLYWALRRLLELLVLARSDRAKEMEILVLRHELQVLRPRSSTSRGLTPSLRDALRRRGRAPPSGASTGASNPASEASSTF
jgi:hypothetical protein